MTDSFLHNHQFALDSQRENDAIRDLQDSGIYPDPDEEICPTGDPLIENVVLNVLDDGFFTDPVEEICTSHISDYVEHSKRTEKRIEELYYP